MDSMGKVFVAVLILAALQTAILLSQPLWFRFLFSTLQLHLDSQTLALLTSTLTIVSLLIEPVATFIVMYLLGRGASLGSFPVPYFTRLLAGAFVGTFVCVVVLMMYYYSTGQGPIPTSLYFASFSYYALGAFRMALVGFAGLALAYFTRPTASLPSSAQP